MLGLVWFGLADSEQHDAITGGDTGSKAATRSDLMSPTTIYMMISTLFDSSYQLSSYPHLLLV